MKNKPSGFPVGMAPYQVTVSYDGTEFCGFQRQKNARTVQAEIESILKKLGWQGQTIQFAGRTDTGVHAEGQVISFRLDWHHTDKELLNALNDSLPRDISAREVIKTREGFHPRFDAKARIYRYQMYLSNSRDALLDRFYWRIWPTIDANMLEKAAEGIVGTHDYRRLGCEVNAEEKAAVKTVDSAKWEFLDRHRLVFQIRAQSFLYHMVRRIVFILVKIGQGKIEPVDLNAGTEFAELPAGIAPANGLFLEKVIY